MSELSVCEVAFRVIWISEDVEGDAIFFFKQVYVSRNTHLNWTLITKGKYSDFPLLPNSFTFLFLVATKFCNYFPSHL